MVTANNKENQNREGNIFGQLWFKYIPYWPLFALLVVVSIISMWVYLRHQIPQYEASATVLIKDEKKGLDDSKMMESLNLLTTKKIIENETEVLHSRSLVGEVVKNLYLYAPVFEEGRFISFPAYTSSPLRIKLLNPDSLIQATGLQFSFDSVKGQVLFENKYHALNEWIITPYGTIMFVRNRSLSGSHQGNFSFSLLTPKTVVQDIVNRLQVSSISKLSTVINIKIKDASPVLAEDIIDEILLQYGKAAITDKNLLAVNALSFLEERLNYVSKDLDSIERKIQLYKSNRGVVDIGTQGRLFLQNVSTNDQKMSEFNIELAVIAQVERYVLSKDKAGGLVPSTLGIRDPLLNQLLEKLYSAELEYERLRKTTAENNPILVSLTDQIQKIKPGILENIKAQRENIQAGKRDLLSTNSSYASVLQGIPQKERELVEISREQSIKNNLYTFLLQKREEAALSHYSTVSDSRIIDNAQATFFPVGPNGKLHYLVAIVMAIALSLGIVTLTEMFNRTILFRRELEAFTSIRVISEIAHEKSRKHLVIGSGENSFVAQQFRRLRATLPHLGINSKKKKILVTSTVSGEGKSFVASNLALTLAIAGKKVVLVEMDLSNPTLGEKLDQIQEIGVTDYLQEIADPEDIIKRTSVHENLFFVSSGHKTVNPFELITSDRVPALLHYLESIFDVVVIDSSPAGLVSDIYSLSPLCDATLYIVRHKYTSKLLVQQLDENIQAAQLTNVAIVFNGIRSRGFMGSNYGYGSGYGYGHVFTAGRYGYATGNYSMK